MADNNRKKKNLRKNIIKTDDLTTFLNTILNKYDRRRTILEKIRASPQTQSKVLNSKLPALLIWQKWNEEKNKPTINIEEVIEGQLKKPLNTFEKGEVCVLGKNGYSNELKQHDLLTADRLECVKKLKKFLSQENFILQKTEDLFQKEINCKMALQKLKQTNISNIEFDNKYLAEEKTVAYVSEITEELSTNTNQSDDCSNDDSSGTIEALPALEDIINMAEASIETIETVEYDSIKMKIESSVENLEQIDGEVDVSQHLTDALERLEKDYRNIRLSLQNTFEQIKTTLHNFKSEDTSKMSLCSKKKDFKNLNLKFHKMETVSNGHLNKNNTPRQTINRSVMAIKSLDHFSYDKPTKESKNVENKLLKGTLKESQSESRVKNVDVKFVPRLKNPDKVLKDMCSGIVPNDLETDFIKNLAGSRNPQIVSYVTTIQVEENVSQDDTTIDEYHQALESLTDLQSTGTGKTANRNDEQKSQKTEEHSAYSAVPTIFKSQLNKKHKCSCNCPLCACKENYDNSTQSSATMNMETGDTDHNKHVMITQAPPTSVKASVKESVVTKASVETLPEEQSPIKEMECHCEKDQQCSCYCKQCKCDSCLLGEDHCNCTSCNCYWCQGLICNETGVLVGDKPYYGHGPDCKCHLCQAQMKRKLIHTRSCECTVCKMGNAPQIIQKQSGAILSPKLTSEDRAAGDTENILGQFSNIVKSNDQCTCPSPCKCEEPKNILSTKSLLNCKCLVCACEPCVAKGKWKKRDCSCDTCQCLEFEYLKKLGNCVCDPCDCVHCLLKNIQADTIDAGRCKDGCVCENCQLRRKTHRTDDDDAACKCKPCICPVCNVMKIKYSEQKMIEIKSEKVVCVCDPCACTPCSPHKDFKKCTCDDCKCNACDYSKQTTQSVATKSDKKLCVCNPCACKPCIPKKDLNKCICDVCKCDGCNDMQSSLPVKRLEPKSEKKLCVCKPCVCSPCEPKKNLAKCICDVCECDGCSKQSKLPKACTCDHCSCQPCKPFAKDLSKCICDVCQCSTCKQNAKLQALVALKEVEQIEVDETKHLPEKQSTVEPTKNIVSSQGEMVVQQIPAQYQNEDVIHNQLVLATTKDEIEEQCTLDPNRAVGHQKITFESRSGIVQNQYIGGQEIQTQAIFESNKDTLQETFEFDSSKQMEKISLQKNITSETQREVFQEQTFLKPSNMASYKTCSCQTCLCREDASTAVQLANVDKQMLQKENLNKCKQREPCKKCNAGCVCDECIEMNLNLAKNTSTNQKKLHCTCDSCKFNDCKLKPPEETRKIQAKNTEQLTMCKCSVCKCDECKFKTESSRKPCDECEICVCNNVNENICKQNVNRLPEERKKIQPKNIEQLTICKCSVCKCDECKFKTESSKKLCDECEICVCDNVNENICKQNVNRLPNCTCDTCFCNCCKNAAKDTCSCSNCDITKCQYKHSSGAVQRLGGTGENYTNNCKGKCARKLSTENHCSNNNYKNYCSQTIQGRITHISIEKHRSNIENVADKENISIDRFFSAQNLTTEEQLRKQSNSYLNLKENLCSRFKNLKQKRTLTNDKTVNSNVLLDTPETFRIENTNEEKEEEDEYKNYLCGGDCEQTSQSEETKTKSDGNFSSILTLNHTDPNNQNENNHTCFCNSSQYEENSMRLRGGNSDNKKLDNESSESATVTPNQSNSTSTDSETSDNYFSTPSKSSVTYSLNNVRLRGGKTHIPCKCEKSQQKEKKSVVVVQPPKEISTSNSTCNCLQCLCTPCEKTPSKQVDSTICTCKPNCVCLCCGKVKSTPNMSNKNTICTCQKCGCTDCSKLKATQSLQISTSECKCTKCGCNPCSKQPKQDQSKDNCICIQCQCQKCKKASVTKAEDNNCNCIECLCQPCQSRPGLPTVAKAPSHVEKPKPNKCTCAVCICEDCKGIRKKKRCTCTICLCEDCGAVKKHPNCVCARCFCDPCEPSKKNTNKCTCTECKCKSCKEDLKRSEGCQCETCTCTPCAPHKKIAEICKCSDCECKACDEKSAKPAGCSCKYCKCNPCTPHEKDTDKCKCPICKCKTCKDLIKCCTCPVCDCDPCQPTRINTQKCTCKVCECSSCKKPKRPAKVKIEEKKTPPAKGDDECKCQLCQCGGVQQTEVVKESKAVKEGGDGVTDDEKKAKKKEVWICVCENICDCQVECKLPEGGAKKDKPAEKIPKNDGICVCEAVCDCQVQCKGVKAKTSEKMLKNDGICVCGDVCDCEVLCKQKEERGTITEPREVDDDVCICKFCECEKGQGEKEPDCTCLTCTCEPCESKIIHTNVCFCPECKCDPCEKTKRFIDDSGRCACLPTCDCGDTCPKKPENKVKNVLCTCKPCDCDPCTYEKPQEDEKMVSKFITEEDCFCLKCKCSPCANTCKCNPEDCSCLSPTKRKIEKEVDKIEQDKCGCAVPCVCVVDEDEDDEIEDNLCTSNKQKIILPHPKIVKPAPAALDAECVCGICTCALCLKKRKLSKNCQCPTPCICPQCSDDSAAISSTTQCKCPVCLCSKCERRPKRGTDKCTCAICLCSKCVVQEKTVDTCDCPICLCLKCVEQPKQVIDKCGCSICLCDSGKKPTVKPSITKLPVVKPSVIQKLSKSAIQQDTKPKESKFTDCKCLECICENCIDENKIKKADCTCSTCLCPDCEKKKNKLQNTKECKCGGKCICDPCEKLAKKEDKQAEKNKKETTYGGNKKASDVNPCECALCLCDSCDKWATSDDPICKCGECCICIPCTHKSSSQLPENLGNQKDCQCAFCMCEHCGAQNVKLSDEQQCRCPDFCICQPCPYKVSKSSKTNIHPPSPSPPPAEEQQCHCGSCCNCDLRQKGDRSKSSNQKKLVNFTETKQFTVISNTTNQCTQSGQQNYGVYGGRQHTYQLENFVTYPPDRVDRNFNKYEIGYNVSDSKKSLKESSSNRNQIGTCTTSDLLLEMAMLSIKVNNYVKSNKNHKIDQEAWNTLRSSTSTIVDSSYTNILKYNNKAYYCCSTKKKSEINLFTSRVFDSTHTDLNFDGKYKHNVSSHSILNSVDTTLNLRQKMTDHNLESKTTSVDSMITNPGSDANGKDVKTECKMTSTDDIEKIENIESEIRNSDYLKMSKLDSSKSGLTSNNNSESNWNDDDIATSLLDKTKESHPVLSKFASPQNLTNFDELFSDIVNEKISQKTLLDCSWTLYNDDFIKILYDLSRTKFSFNVENQIWTALTQVNPDLTRAMINTQLNMLLQSQHMSEKVFNIIQINNTLPQSVSRAIRREIIKSAASGKINQTDITGILEASSEYCLLPNEVDDNTKNSLINVLNGANKKVLDALSAASRTVTQALDRANRDVEIALQTVIKKKPSVGAGDIGNILKKKENRLDYNIGRKTTSDFLVTETDRFNTDQLHKAESNKLNTSLFVNRATTQMNIQDQYVKQDLIVDDIMKVNEQTDNERPADGSPESEFTTGGDRGEYRAEDRGETQETPPAPVDGAQERSGGGLGSGGAEEEQEENPGGSGEAGGGADKKDDCKEGKCDCPDQCLCTECPDRPSSPDEIPDCDCPGECQCVGCPSQKPAVCNCKKCFCEECQDKTREKYTVLDEKHVCHCDVCVCEKCTGEQVNKGCDCEGECICATCPMKPIECSCPVCLCTDCEHMKSHGDACKCAQCLCADCPKGGGTTFTTKQQKISMVPCKCPICLCQHCPADSKKTCSCAVCLCEPCPELQGKKQHECSCYPQCDCDVCPDPAFKKEPIKMDVCQEMKEKSKPEKHPLNCKCSTCKCDPCYKKEPAPACKCGECCQCDPCANKVPPPKKEGCKCKDCKCKKCEPVPTHPVDCKCSKCCCKPCASKPEEHPPNCKCSKCVCGVCKFKPETPQITCKCSQCCCDPCQAKKQPTPACPPPASTGDCKCNKCACTNCSKKGPPPCTCSCCLCSPCERKPKKTEEIGCKCSTCTCSKCAFKPPCPSSPPACPPSPCPPKPVSPCLCTSCKCTPCADPTKTAAVKASGDSKACECPTCRCPSCPSKDEKKCKCPDPCKCDCCPHKQRASGGGSPQTPKGLVPCKCPSPCSCVSCPTKKDSKTDTAKKCSCKDPCCCPKCSGKARTPWPFENVKPCTCPQPCSCATCPGKNAACPPPPCPPPPCPPPACPPPPCPPPPACPPEKKTCSCDTPCICSPCPNNPCNSKPAAQKDTSCTTCNCSDKSKCKTNCSGYTKKSPCPSGPVKFPFEDIKPCACDSKCGSTCKCETCPGKISKKALTCLDTNISSAKAKNPCPPPALPLCPPPKPAEPPCPPPPAPPLTCDFKVYDVRKLTEDSLFLKWTPSPLTCLTGYEIDVNGCLSHRVRNKSRCMAVLFNLKFEKPIQLSVFAMTLNGRVQPPATTVFSQC